MSEALIVQVSKEPLGEFTLKTVPFRLEPRYSQEQFDTILL